MLSSDQQQLSRAAQVPQGSGSSPDSLEGELSAILGNSSFSPGLSSCQFGAYHSKVLISSVIGFLP